MKRETKEMFDACVSARNIMNGYTRNCNFKYKTKEAAKCGLNDKCSTAFNLINAVAEKDMTNAAEREYEKTLAYIGNAYAKYRDFIEKRSF